MAKLEELLGECDVCKGHTQLQYNEPFRIETCTRCHGSGKNRIVQIMEKNTCLLALSANGGIFRYVESSHGCHWQKYPFFE